MTKEQFKKLWTDRYPNSIPLSHVFKNDFPNRWFRIHSLPESKRYPDNEGEWGILLERQNEIITDVLGENAKIIVVTGGYHWEEYTVPDTLSEINSLKRLSLTSIDLVDLHEARPIEYDTGQFFRPFFCAEVWTRNHFDNILRDIAQDNLRAFFMAIEKDVVIAPYDGGMDLVLKDSRTRDHYKAKYHDWLSDREDGM